MKSNQLFVFVAMFLIFNSSVVLAGDLTIKNIGINKNICDTWVVAVEDSECPIGEFMDCLSNSELDDLMKFFNVVTVFHLFGKSFPEDTKSDLSIINKIIRSGMEARILVEKTFQGGCEGALNKK